MKHKEREEEFFGRRDRYTKKVINDIIKKFKSNEYRYERIKSKTDVDESETEAEKRNFIIMLIFLRLCKFCSKYEI